MGSDWFVQKGGEEPRESPPKSTPPDSSRQAVEFAEASKQHDLTAHTELSELRTLLRLTTAINSGVNVNEVLNYIYDVFQEIIPYDRVDYALVDENTQTVETLWTRAEGKMHVGAGYAAALTETTLAHLLETQEPRIINNLDAYLQEHPASTSTPPFVREGVRSSLTCPLVVGGKPVGFLFFSSQKPGTYESRHTTVFRKIAMQVSTIVEKARLYQELSDTKHTLLETNRVLAQMANVDGLTSVANRRFFDSVFEREWRRAVRLTEPLSIMLIDIDFFKQYNDLYGHLAGDDCLKRVARTLANRARRGADLVARYGGEEFVVLLADTDLKDATDMAEYFRNQVQMLNIPHGRSCAADTLTISVGVAGGVPHRQLDHSGLLGMADTALYQAKAAGRNRVAQADW